MEQEELARRTGMPLARIIGIENGRLPLTDDDTDAVAHVLDVPADLLAKSEEQLIEHKSGRTSSGIIGR
jgi:transcriptional regulator with XRE-family HTH domain